MIRPSSSTAKKAVSTKPEQIATRNLSMWVRETKCILSKLQFGLVGYGVAADGTLDSTRRILRCPSCWAQFEEHNDEKTQYTLQNSKHEPGCTIRVLLDLYVVQVASEYQSITPETRKNKNTGTTRTLKIR